MARLNRRIRHIRAMTAAQVANQKAIIHCYSQLQEVETTLASILQHEHTNGDSETEDEEEEVESGDERDVDIVDPVQFIESDSEADSEPTSQEHKRQLSPKSKFRNLFNYDVEAQSYGTTQLSGLKGRAGYGNSDRNKRRKLARENQRRVEGSQSISIPRLFEREKSRQTAKSSPPPLAEEPRAVFTKEQQSKLDALKGIAALEKRLKSKRVQKNENLVGGWRTRHEMVLRYLQYQIKMPGEKSTKASLAVAATFNRGEWVSRCIQRWSTAWLEERKIPRGEQGIQRRMSMWYEDEGLMLFMRGFISEKGEKLTSETLAAAVGRYLLSDEHAAAVLEDLKQASLKTGDGEEDGGRPQLYKKTSIRALTARRWLRHMGFRYRDIRKGVFVDGHERPDVVEYRKQFIQTLAALQPRLVEYDESGSIISKPSPLNDEKLLVLCTHDESTFSANDSRRNAWHNEKEGQNYLQKKGRGRGIMVSDCLFSNGRVCVPDHISDSAMLAKGLDPKRRNATEYFEYGKNNDGYWTSENVVKHILDVVVPMVELIYPLGVYQGLFLFDNAVSHACFASDALQAISMNKDPGGKNAALLRDGYFVDHTTSVRCVQPMAFGLDHTQHAGKPKGLKIVLEERGLWRQGMRLDCGNKQCSDCKEIDKKREVIKATLACNNFGNACASRKRCQDCMEKINSIPKKVACVSCKLLREHSNDSTANGCCARRVMSLQPDFLAQKGKLQEEIEARGHMVLFYLRFHCELNWIEYYWERAKKFARDNCGYSLDALRQTVPQALAFVDSQLVGKYFRRSMRILKAYEKGLIFGSSEFVSTVYKSHRRVKESAGMEEPEQT